MAEASYTPSRKLELIGPAESRAAHPFSAASAASAVAPLLRLRWAWSKYLDPALLAGVAANDTRGSAAATKMVLPNRFNQHSIFRRMTGNRIGTGSARCPGAIRSEEH